MPFNSLRRKCLILCKRTGRYAAAGHEDTPSATVADHPNYNGLLACPVSIQAAVWRSNTLLLTDKSIPVDRVKCSGSWSWEFQSPPRSQAFVSLRRASAAPTAEAGAENLRFQSVFSPHCRPFPDSSGNRTPQSGDPKAGLDQRPIVRKVSNFEKKK